MTKRILLPLPRDLLDRIDSVRGFVPRTVWIRSAIFALLQKVEEQQKQGS